MKSSAVQLQNHSPQTIIYDKLFRPIHDLRVSVIDRCNFRCNYCMPQEHFHEKYTFLNKEEWLQFGEIVRLVKLFTSRGVSKVRITGGEPLLREELFELVHLLAAMTEIDDLALTTNGFFLKKQARQLKAAGLHRLTVSLDTLDEKIFSKINGGKGSVREVLSGIREAEACGFGSVKINTVIQRGVNDSTVLDLIEYFRGSPHIIRFIEYMDVGNKNHWSKEKERLALFLRSASRSAQAAHAHGCLPTESFLPAYLPRKELIYAHSYDSAPATKNFCRLSMQP